MEQEHAETYAQFKSIREDSQQLWKINSIWNLPARIWNNHSNTHPTNRIRKFDSFILSERG